MPLIGGGYDGTYYGAKGNENIISALGNSAPVTGLTYDYGTNLAKQARRHQDRIGGLRRGGFVDHVGPGRAEYAAPASGLEPVYLNTSVDFATTDVGPIVQGLKNSGADAVYLPLVLNTDLAIAQGLQQNGVPMKAVLMESGYGQATLDSPIAKTLDSSRHRVAELQARRAEERPGGEAVPVRPEEVRRHHRRPRPGCLLGVHRVRPGHHRAAAGG